jgi:inner membrane protein involved in colicin E2 resistance
MGLRYGAGGRLAELESLPDSLRLVFSLAPAVSVLLVGASMYNTWTINYQPQGRYLFVALVPIATWLWGTLPWEGQRPRAIRLGSILVLLALSATVLWTTVL